MIMNVDNTLVSIITVVFNGEKTIRQAIESVLNQTYDNIEYIIQDGLSTDDTISILESYKEQFETKNLSYYIVSEKDNGIYDAMNKGISKATGEIIGMINCDDWYELDTIEKVVDNYHKTNFDMLYGDVKIIRNSGKTSIKHSKIRKYVTTRDWNHPTTFVKRTVYDKYKYKCESLYDDFDLVLRVRNGNSKVVIINEVLANFRFGGISNEKNIKKAIKRAKIRYSIYRKNDYSRFYLIESYGHEIAKYLMS